MKSITKKRMESIIGKVAEFAIQGVGYYQALVEDSTPAGFHGLVLSFDNAYSGSCVPNSVVPKIEYVDVRFDDPDVSELRFRNAGYQDKYFKETALLAQNGFLQRMVGNGQGINIYQSLVFNITEVEDSSIPNCKFDTRGTYCDMEIENLLGIQMDEDIKNPYVVKATYNADDYCSMRAAYDRYLSAAGQLQPDTIITYNVASYSKPALHPFGKRKHLCSVSIPYKTLREKGLDVFPIELPKGVENLINDTIVFLQKNKQLWSEQIWPREETTQDTIERD